MKRSLLAAALLLMLGGCGSGTKTVIVTQPTTSTAASVTTPLLSTSSASGTTTASSAASTSSAATTSSATSTAAGTTVELGTFRSPSSNIGCDVINTLARCDISHRDWSPPPHPASCPQEVDFGQGLEVGASGPGQFVCAGDTALDPQAPALPYGDAAGVGAFICSSSATTGITCVNHNTGHGFDIAIQGYRLF
jgi:hypothetical protein